MKVRVVWFVLIVMKRMRMNECSFSKSINATQKKKNGMCERVFVCQPSFAPCFYRDGKEELSADREGV